jgi:uracil-DNA glycosylase family 4
MIVGQAPGKEETTKLFEDKTLKTVVTIPMPFCGPAGIYLMATLRRFDIQEGDYIMSNCVTFYPTKEDGRSLRAPTPEEIRLERPRLIREIFVIKPKLIMAFGKEAIWSTVYFGNQPIIAVKPTLLNGNVEDCVFMHPDDENATHSCKVLMLYHPSYLRRMKVNEEPEYGTAASQFMSAFLNNRDIIQEAIGRELLIGR